MKKLVFVAFFAICSVGFAMSNPNDVDVNYESTDYKIVETTEHLAYLFNKETKTFDCTVYVSVDLVYEDGSVRRIYEGYQTFPDDYDACGGSELIAVKVVCD